jgi:hypothetical protein
MNKARIIQIGTVTVLLIVLFLLVRVSVNHKRVRSAFEIHDSIRKHLSSTDSYPIDSIGEEDSLHVYRDIPFGISEEEFHKTGLQSVKINNYIFSVKPLFYRGKLYAIDLCDTPQGEAELKYDLYFRYNNLLSATEEKHMRAIFYSQVIPPASEFKKKQVKFLAVFGDTARKSYSIGIGRLDSTYYSIERIADLNIVKRITE